jgi:hypothetical protein
MKIIRELVIFKLITNVTRNNMAATIITSAMDMKDIYHDLRVDLKGRGRKGLSVRFYLITR